MALPPNQPNSLQGTMQSRQIQQYQEFSMKEAIKTATKAGLFTAVSNQIANSTVLRRIPGMASVREGMELKKRELYDRTGRDESGRKLTKRELEDRELRRKDAGALASIWELLDQDWRNGVPVVIKGMESAAFAMMSGFGNNAAGGERFRPISREYGRRDDVRVASSEEGAYDIMPDVQDESSERLQRREEAAEQERADDADQDRDQEQEEGFFSKLFSKTFGSRDRSKSGGLIDSLIGMIGPLLGIFGGGGGIVGMLSGLVAPLIGVLATAGTAILGVITPLLPAIVGGLIVGAAGLAISKWIDSLINKMKNPTENIGVTRAYTYTDSSGKKSIKTAAELKTTDEDIASGKFSTPGLNPNAYFVETKDGKPTDKLTAPYGDRRTPEQAARGMAAYRDLKGEKMSLAGVGIIQQLNIASKKAQQEGRANEEQRKNLRSQLYALDTMMYSFVEDVNQGLDPSNVGTLAKRWNDIREKAIEFQKLGDELGIKNTLYYLNRLTNEYAPFKDLVTWSKDIDGWIVNPAKAKAMVGTKSMSHVLVPDRTGELRSVKSMNNVLPSVVGPDYIESAVKFKPDPNIDRQLPPAAGEEDPLRDLDYLLGPTSSGESRIEANPYRKRGGLLDQLSAAMNRPSSNAVGGGQAPTIITNNSPTNNVMSSTTARTPTGIDLAQMFNGARLATI